MNNEESKNKEDNIKEFKLGIVIAGGVSAGAYSAGAMYYLLNNLKEWENKKEEEKEKISKNPSYVSAIPMHDVVIEVIAGASAGSLAAAIICILYDIDISEIKYGDTTSETWFKENESNLYYDLWVHMLDKKDNPYASLSSLLKPKKDKDSLSLLNSELINKLAEDLVNFREKNSNLKRTNPNYISKDLNFIFTLTNLRGVEVRVDFNKLNNNRAAQNTSKNPAHKMKVHKMLAHYTLSPKPDNASKIMKLNRDNKQQLTDFINAAKASGAFPFAFTPRELKFTKSYIEEITENYYKTKSNTTTVNNNLTVTAVLDDKDDKIYNFHAVDGGTLNNEPMNEVLSVLKKKKDVQEKYHCLILIDPFPNFEKDEGKYQGPNTFFNLGSKILNALRGQAMVKGTNYLEEFEKANGRFGMIYPSRRDEYGKSIKGDNHIASSALGGFAGFLSPTFRAHDFMLGMKNCQSFLRKYFYILGSDVNNYQNDFGNSWYAINSEMYRTFKYDENNNTHLPIIPDMMLLKEQLYKYPLSPKKPITAILMIEFNMLTIAKNTNVHKNTFAPIAFPTIDAAIVKNLKWPIFKLLNRLLWKEILFKKKPKKSAGKDNKMDAKSSAFWSLIAKNKKVSRNVFIATIILFLFTLGIIYYYIDQPYIFWIFVIICLLFFAGIWLGVMLLLSGSIVNTIYLELEKNELLKKPN